MRKYKVSLWTGSKSLNQKKIILEFGGVRTQINMRLSALHCKNSTGAIISQTTCIVQYTQQSEKFVSRRKHTSVCSRYTGWRETLAQCKGMKLLLFSCSLCMSLSSVTTTTKRLKKKSLPVHSSLCSSLASFKVLWPLLIFECCLQVVQGNKSFELCVSVCVCVLFPCI